MSETVNGAQVSGQANGGVVVLVADGALANIIVNGLSERLADRSGPLTVIAEEPEGKLKVVKRRIKILGIVPALGQLAFGLVQRALWPNTRRIHRIWSSYGLDPRSPHAVTIHRVPSVNSLECRALLRELRPAVVAVYGTRILKRATLLSVDAPFINYHAGINPKYRGQHPGYWALAEGDEDNAGVTIHLVDQGVDTGAVLYQARVLFGEDDTIASYQHVQAAHALPLFARAINDALQGRLKPRAVALPSRQYFPPTLWRYLSNGLTKGVW
ncbi:MAG: formyl transferase [Hyphomicrobium sp.]|nr:formyl transferase [Hyphomicrobium sp.]